MTPSNRFVGAVALASAAVFGTLAGVRLELTLIPTLVVFAIGIVDRLTGTPTPLELTREVKPVMSVGVSHTIKIFIRNLSSRVLKVDVADEPPVQGKSEPAYAVRTARVGSFEKVICSYRFTPNRRGRYGFGGIEVRHLSFLGLWTVVRRFEVLDEVDVYPNIEALHRFELLARVNNLNEIGVRAIRMKGEGTEFERMREYRPGDEPRKVDWKVTARLGKLIVREMGEERNQSILLLIDMGRMMRQKTRELSHFDYALNTAIILGYIAEKRGDNVGAVFFSDKVHKYVPPGRGRGTIDAIVRAGYNIEPGLAATNFSRVFRYITTYVRKRSLLLLMTHLIPGDDALLIQGYLGMLKRQHLPLCLFFQEPELEEEVGRIPGSLPETFYRAASADMLIARKEGLTSLRQAGVMAVDALPGELSAVAVSHYLDIKARNLL